MEIITLRLRGVTSDFFFFFGVSRSSSAAVSLSASCFVAFGAARFLGITFGPDFEIDTFFDDVCFGVSP